MVGQTGEILSHNMYAYTSNNPVMREDEDGYFWNIIAGGLAGGIIELGTQLIANGGDFSDVSWEKVAISAATGALTAAVGPLAGSINSGASSVGMDAIDGNIDSLEDAITSFSLGTATALASYGIGTAVGKATKSLTKIEKIGRIADKGQKGYFGAKYSYNKGSGRAIRSVEIHGNHNNHGIHLQFKKWNPFSGRSSTYKRIRLW